MIGHYYSNYADVLGLVLPGDEQGRFDPPSDIRGFPVKEITCMVRGKVKIDPAQIVEIRSIETDDGYMTQLVSKRDCYYVSGVAPWVVAEELGIEDLLLEHEP